MQRKRALIILLFAFSLLLVPFAMAANCCININSQNFCSDSTADQCCGNDDACKASSFIAGTDCSATGFCYSQRGGCCVDSCTSPERYSVSTPLACSDPKYYSINPCSNYAECAPLGCAFCFGKTTPLPTAYKLIEARTVCLQTQGQPLSFFNSSTTDCTNLQQPVSVSLSVSGKVTNLSGEAVSGAAVKIAGVETTTDSSGNYNLVGLPAGNFTARVWHLNYYENLTPIILNQSKTLDIVLNPIETSTLLVNVSDYLGNPAIGASVTVEGIGTSQLSSNPVNFVNLPRKYPDGRLRAYKITAVLGTQATVFTNLSQNPTTVNINLAQQITGQGAINGYVLNSSGINVSNAVVAVAGRSFTTTANGFYEFSGLNAGPYDISVTPPAPYLFQSRSVTINPDETTHYNFTVQQAAERRLATLTIQIKDASDNTPISDAQVNITPEGAITPQATLLSDENGNASQELTIDVSYTIIVSKAGYGDARTSIILSNNQSLSIFLSKVSLAGNTISGFIKDSNSSAGIEGAAVYLQGFENTFFDRSRSDGSYLISGVPSSVITPRIYTLVSEKTGYQKAYLSVTLQGFDISKNISLRSAECFSTITSPVISSLKMQGNKTSLKFSTPCPIKGYYVYRCSGAGCSQTEPITNLISPEQAEFVDDQIEPGKWYTYEIRAYYEYPFVQEKTSDPASIYTGARECFNLNTQQLCYNNVRSACDENNTIVRIEARNESFFCMQSGMTTKFVQKVDCAVQCNQPLGMFSFFGKLTGIGEKQSAINCSDYAVLRSLHLEYCYKDYAKTVASIYYPCSNLTSCYDYLSRDACEQNQCSANSPGNCIWRSYSNDLSLGVCMPKDEDYWNCSRCNGVGKFNNLFGTCDAGICDLYGGEVSSSGNALSHYCFFLRGQCVKKDLASCDNYGNSEQCIDGQGNVAVNTYGDNSITHASKDLLDFGLCRFGSTEEKSQDYRNGCFKDANNDSLHDPNPQDVKPPFTSVVHPTAANAINFPVVVYDDESMKTILDNAGTFFSISKGAFIRPSLVAQNGIIFYGGLDEDGNYTIWYYSNDSSANLEVVKRFSVFIDRVPPAVDFSYTYSQGVLSVLINSSETIRCDAQLHDDSNNVVQPENNLEGWMGQSVSTSYNVSDGIYYYDFSCKDWVSNEISKIPLIIVDTEGMIYDGEPNSTVKLVDTISVRTRASADCKYVDADTNNDGAFEISDGDFAGMDFSSLGNNFQTEDGKYHHARVSVTNDSIAKKYYVRCMLRDSPTETKRNTAPIIFAVDRLPPSTKLFEALNVTTPIEYNTSSWRRQANILLECVDPQSPAVIPPGYLGPREFGCAVLNYCIAPQSDCELRPATINYTEPNSSRKIAINATEKQISLNETRTICFNSTDNGGNEEAKRCILVPIDRISPRVKVTDISGKCSDFDGIDVCKTNKIDISVNGTVDNAAFWSPTGSADMGYFKNFTLTTSVSSSTATEAVFDKLGDLTYDYVQLVFSSNSISYGQRGAAATQMPVNVILSQNVPVDLTVVASGGTATVYLNGEIQGSFQRISPEGWISTNNQSFKDVLVIDDEVTSPLNANLSILINRVETQKIAIVNGLFTSTVDLSSLLSQLSTEGLIEFQATDAAGNVGTDSFWAVIDLSGPLTPPVFDPPLDSSVNTYGENYDNLRYPVHYDAGDDIYYVGAKEGQVYLTGRTSEPGIRLELWSDGTENISEYTEPSNETYKILNRTFMVAANSPQGSNQVTLAGDVESAITGFGNIKYASFLGYHRTAYGNYGDSYQILNAAAGRTGTVISLGSGLDSNVNQSKIVALSNMPRTPDRFMMEVDLTDTTYSKHEWQLLQFDEFNNTGVPSNPLTVVIDSVSPNVTSKFPAISQGTVQLVQNISVDVFEEGSGLRTDNIDFTINGKKQKINVIRGAIGFDVTRGLLAQYRLFYNYNQTQNGVYQIRLRFTDKANNAVDLSWNLTVDRDLPRQADFFITNNVSISKDPDGWSYVRGVPDVMASYVNDSGEKPAIVEVVSSFAARTYPSRMNIPASCSRIGNTDTFSCVLSITNDSLTDGDYELDLWAVKSFSDGTTSNATLSKFFFVKDTETPQVSGFHILNEFMQSNANMSYTTTVPNERHALKVSIAIEQDGTSYNIFSSTQSYATSLYYGTVSDTSILAAKAKGLLFNDSQTYNIRINVSDYAGNFNDTENDSVTIDDTKPWIFPQDIAINATPIYSFTYGGITPEGEVTVYIVRGDNLSVSGKVPPDVVDLSFYRITNGTSGVKIFSLKPCESPIDVTCVNNVTGEFKTPVTSTFVSGIIGQVVNNIILINATDRADNRAQITKLIYADLEKPTITVCTLSGCSQNISEAASKPTNATEIKRTCGMDVTCYDRLIRGACTNDSGFSESCYSDYIASQIKNPDLCVLCLGIGIRRQDCIEELAVNSCTKGACTCGGILDSQSVAACEEMVQDRKDKNQC